MQTHVLRRGLPEKFSPLWMAAVLIGGWEDWFSELPAVENGWCTALGTRKTGNVLSRQLTNLASRKGSRMPISWVGGSGKVTAFQGGVQNFL